MSDDVEDLLHLLVGGDTEAAASILERAEKDTTPRLLVAAAMLTDAPSELLSRAAAHARTTRDRQLVAVAAAHLENDEELFHALVRDHLADHPDNVLAAWIAAQHTHSARSAPSTP
jgi:DNA polymerase III delta subunit